MDGPDRIGAIKRNGGTVNPISLTDFFFQLTRNSKQRFDLCKALLQPDSFF